MPFRPGSCSSPSRRSAAKSAVWVRPRRRVHLLSVRAQSGRGERPRLQHRDGSLGARLDRGDRVPTRAAAPHRRGRRRRRGGRLRRRVGASACDREPAHGEARGERPAGAAVRRHDGAEEPPAGGCPAAPPAAADPRRRGRYRSDRLLLAPARPRHLRPDRHHHREGSGRSPGGRVRRSGSPSFERELRLRARARRPRHSPAAENTYRSRRCSRSGSIRRWSGSTSGTRGWRHTGGGRRWGGRRERPRRHACRSAFPPARLLERSMRTYMRASSRDGSCRSADVHSASASSQRPRV